MAAMAAQRYPTLFDGILGGGAVLNLSQNGGIYGSWVVQANTDINGERILNHQNFADKLPVLHEAIVKQCDASDGKTDGMITRPRDCRVDVSTLPRCHGSHAQTCFTAEELGVLEKWYQGPVNSSGQSLYPGMPAGSEPYWAVWFLDRGGRTAPGNALGGDYTRYIGFENGAPEGYTALDFDFDRDPVRLEARGRLLDALDADLSPFRAAGGKFLMWHGWQDPLVLPDQSVAYYEDVLETMGGQDTVDDFFRLFMIPGQGHCWEMPSDAPDRFDPITALDQWVETGMPPSHLTATAIDPAQSEIEATVICPWPGDPQYLDRDDELPEGQAACEPNSSRK
jgi:feruloyl esterase